MERPLTKRAVIERLCALAAEVGEAHGHQLAHDCFCGKPRSSPLGSFLIFDTGFRFEVLDFIESAVRAKLKARKARKPTKKRKKKGRRT